jgi:hypothetical protein
MTESKLISVKIPERVLQHIPRAGNGRSRFIVAALEEKISRSEVTEWKPSTKRGRRLAALLAKGRDERAPFLDAAGIATELSERRGKLH